ncbi:hypothetical protein TorRG33x02_298560 [Trema orientale]|uniref:Uncharacterized protein n=1 Tax=Trema orientale TaxID=63057 RepID=A0A2P5C3U5_TREOI|nr:hypothetical protein TorRG33x02_298560 [Trema orientale]
MGSLMEIGVQAKKLAIISIRTCFRSVRNHPFLVGMVLFLIFLYRSFPFMFSLFMSASPVLVCTAVLLGTLLSFGQSNLPEIEKEEKITQDVVSLKAGLSGNGTVVVDRDESFVIERYADDRGELVDKSIEDAGPLDEKVRSKVENDVDSLDRVPLIDVNSREIHTEKRVIEEVEREFFGLEFESKRETHKDEVRAEGVLSDEKAFGNEYSLVQEMGDDILEKEFDKSLEDSLIAHKEDHLEPSLPAGGGDEADNDEDDDEDGSSYSGSDRAESSSPDASMADIIPMLDELHPLLDEEAPQLPHMPHDDSDAASEHSHGSDDNVESDAESENQRDEVEEDGADDNDDDEEAHVGKEDESKSAIKWTEDDQKNLMDLGTSELERNQRLENLIARRRARKSFKLVAEKNLIDLESADLPFNVAPILTTRHNPFDTPYDSYENMGLPPIPGSAPSILLPRRNPFDLPYDSSEEKPDLKGDNFEQEFLAFHQKDMFRRYESFSLGPSGLGNSTSRQERQNIKWKPVFVPERMASEGTSYPSFQRQSSELSDSKLSSVPDTESISSLADADEKKLSEQDFSKEAELLSTIYQASDLLEHGSQSSGDVDSVEMVQAGKSDIQHDEAEIASGEVENKIDTHLSETGEAAAHVELHTSTIHLQAEQVGREEYSSRSSSSSLSEVDDRISDVKNEDNFTSFGAGGDYVDESVISALPSLEESEFRFISGVVDDNQNKEPVYDSSPPAAERLRSLSSVSSDLQVEMSEILKPPTLAENAVSFDYRESEVHGESIEKDTSGCEEVIVASTKVVAVGDIPLESGEVKESSALNVSKVASSGVGPENGDQIGHAEPEAAFVHVSVDSGSFSSEIQLVEDDRINEQKNIPNEHDYVYSSNRDVDVPSAVHQTEEDKLHTTTSSDQIWSEDLITPARQEEQPSGVVEHASVDSSLSTSKTEPLVEQAVVQDETIHLDQDQILSDVSAKKSSVEETFKDDIIQPEKNQVQSPSSDSEIQVESSEDLAVQLDSLESGNIPSSDMILAGLEEAQPSFVVEQDSVIRPSLGSSENDHKLKHPLHEEEITQAEQDQLHSSSSDVKVDPSGVEEFDLKVASSSTNDEDLPSAEKSPSELGKEFSWSDKSTVEPCVRDCAVLNEPAVIMRETKEDSSIIGDVCDPVDKMLANVSSGNSDSVSIPSDSLEYKPFAGQIDLSNSILDGTVNDNHLQLSEHSDYELKAHVGEENTKEEVDEIKDIDEGMLSELDAVGDFSVKEVVELLHSELILEELDAVGDFSVKEVGESLHSELILEEANVGNTKPELLLPSASNLTGRSPELPVLEARSLKDIDLAFTQLQEGADVEEVILPSVIEKQLVLEESKSSLESTSDLQVVEARSLDDIHIALKQVSENNVAELPTPLNSESESAEFGVNEVGNSTEIESGSVESGVKEGSSIAADVPKHESSVGADKPKHGSNESVENSNRSTPESKDKSNARKARSGSSSSSSSSSNSSSSDSE